MQALAGFLTLALLIFLVVGLIKPSIIGRYVSSPSRWKVFGIFVVGMVIVAIVAPSPSEAAASDETAQAAVADPAESYTPEQRDSVAKVEREQMIAERESSTLSARDLVRAYDGNEVRADENFEGKTFYVEGVVTDIKKDILDEIYVTLEGQSFRSVQCFLDDEKIASQLDRGMRVTFRGECRGLMMNVLMYDCELVENLDDLRAG